MASLAMHWLQVQDPPREQEMNASLTFYNGPWDL